MTDNLRVYGADELPQGSEAWLAARCGMLTASTIGQLITTKAMKLAANDTTRGLIMTLAAERITGRVDDVYMSDAMIRGTEEEPLARDLYEKHYSPVEQVGFMVRTFDNGHRLGFSPDGLVGDTGIIEIKSRSQKVQVATILANEVPANNMAQIMAGLVVSGRDFADYISYSNGMPLLVKCVHLTDEWRALILDALNHFEENVATIVDRYTANVEGLPVATYYPDLEDIRI